MDIIPDRYPIRSRDKSKSNGQFLLGRLIQSIYGNMTIILEEFPIPEERLWLDFYLPHYNLAFEYQGEQHDTFNKFFHVDKNGFNRSIERDQRKRKWCQLNAINLIEVRGNVSQDDLMQLIQGENYE